MNSEAVDHKTLERQPENPKTVQKKKVDFELTASEKLVKSKRASQESQVESMELDHPTPKEIGICCCITL